MPPPRCHARTQSHSAAQMHGRRLHLLHSTLYFLWNLAHLPPLCLSSLRLRVPGTLRARRAVSTMSTGESCHLVAGICDTVR